MQTGNMRMRLMRPVERQSMKEWLIDKLDGKEIPGLEWVNRDIRVFKIKWCHGSRHGWSLKDSVLFEKWAQHSGRHDKANPTRWKANFRCALNSLKDVEEVKEMSVSKGHNASKVYRIFDCRKKMDKPRPVKRQKTEADVKSVANEVTKSFAKDSFPAVSPNVTTTRTATASESHFIKSEWPEGDLDVSENNESEGYQTDVQAEERMECSANDRVSFVIEPKAENSIYLNLPNFDKIIPGLCKVEYGKMHLLRQHNSGFRVDLLKQPPPLTPILHTFSSSGLNMSTQQTALLNVTANIPPLQTKSADVTANKAPLQTTSADVPANISPLLTTNPNYDQVTFLETPDGSDVSQDSNCEDYIEVTIYEEEVSNFPRHDDGSIVLMGVDNSYNKTTLPDYINTDQSEYAHAQSQFDIDQSQHVLVEHAEIVTDQSFHYPLTPP